MAFYLLDKERIKAAKLANTLSLAIENVGHCKKCRTFTENELCPICESDKRDKKIICIVETPADVLAVESGGYFHGCYFVLMGHISPLDGIGPKDLGLEQLEVILVNSEVKELILATNPTIEGEATAHYIAAIANKYEIKVSRIAHGVPVGSELGYIDNTTLAMSFNSRVPYSN